MKVHWKATLLLIASGLLYHHSRGFDSFEEWLVFGGIVTAVVVLALVLRIWDK